MASESGSAGATVIWGATGGLGTALARRLAGRGTPLLLLGRDAERLATLQRDLPGEHRTAVVPAEQTGELEAAVAAAAEAFGGLHGAVNCIGSVMLKPAHLTSLEDFNATLQLNVGTAFALLRAAVRPMMAGGGGSIVLVSSAAARIGLANHEAIAAAKGAVAGLALSAAATYARSGIRVNCVAPGLVQTALTQRITSNEASRNASLAMHALGRLGEAEDVAGLIEYLLSPQTSWITGQHIGVDGGLADLRSR